MQSNKKNKVTKHTINFDSSVVVNVNGKVLNFKGPKGELNVTVSNDIDVSLKDNSVCVQGVGRKGAMFAGLYKALIRNAILGVTQGFEKKLELVGVGYRASIQNGNLVLNVGYSHPVTLEKSEGIDFDVKDNLITVRGIDKVKVGDYAAKIRSIRPPDRYKGKGIRYYGEAIILKKSKGKK